MALTTFTRLSAYDQLRTITKLAKKSPLSLRNILELVHRTDPIISIRPTKPPIIKSPLPPALVSPGDIDNHQDSD